MRGCNTEHKLVVSASCLNMFICCTHTQPLHCLAYTITTLRCTCSMYAIATLYYVQNSNTALLMYKISTLYKLLLVSDLLPLFYIAHATLPTDLSQFLMYIFIYIRLHIAHILDCDTVLHNCNTVSFNCNTACCTAVSYLHPFVHIHKWADSPLFTAYLQITPQTGKH